jgi:hypothetical protein
MTDRAYPLAFLMAAAFASSLVWVYTLMGQLLVP